MKSPPAAGPVSAPGLCPAPPAHTFPALVPPAALQSFPGFPGWFPAFSGPDPVVGAGCDAWLSAPTCGKVLNIIISCCSAGVYSLKGPHAQGGPEIT